MDHTYDRIFSENTSQDEQVKLEEIAEDDSMVEYYILEENAEDEELEELAEDEIEYSRRVPGRGSYPCSVCGLILNSRGASKRHEFTHTNEWPCICTICGKGFADQNRLDKHSQCHSDERVSCEICDKKVKPRSIYAHIQMHKGTKKKQPPLPKTLVCPYCTKAYSSKIPYDTHISSHTGERNFLCDICGKGFGGKVNLYLHKKRHTFNHPDENKVRCKQCNKLLKPDSLWGHMLIHQGIKRVRKLLYFCRFCDKGFYSKFHLDLHESSHSEIKNYACDQCDKRFTSELNLKQHLIHHLPRTIECNLCGSLYPTDKTLAVHQKMVHDQFKKFKCKYCPKLFGFRGLLKKHVLLHTEGPQFKCPHCERRFKFNQNLQSHVTSMHTNDRPYFCQTCSRSFASRMKLYTHVQKTHRKPKPKPGIECVLCGKLCKSKQLYKTHLQSRAHELRFLSASSEEQERVLFSLP